jgi:hypothetical protein
MENHTKRIRKARRQGLAENGKALARSPRARFSTRLAGADDPSTPRPNARRKSLTTARKQKRQVRSASRRNVSPARARASR